jgi:hypothetical protein
VAKNFRLQGRGQVLIRGSIFGFKDDVDGGLYTIHYQDGDREYMDSREYQNSYNLGKDDDQREVTYVAHLRHLLRGLLLLLYRLKYAIRIG